MGQFVSRGARSSHSCRRQQNQLDHQGDKVHRTVRPREQTALRDKSVWSSSGEAARGAKDLRGGDIREQRPDAALNVPSAETAQAREEQRDSTTTGSTRYADRSISLGMSVSRGAR